MSETPSSKPRHALSDTGVSVPVQGGPRDDLFGVGAEGAAMPQVPEPASPADDRAVGAAPAGPDRAAAEAPTQALPVIPRPRDDRAAGHPTVATLARLPEPFRPAPVHTAPAAASSGSGRFRLPELPWTARPVLGAATVLILACGVVAGMNGGPAPAPAPPQAPAPVSSP